MALKGYKNPADPTPPLTEAKFKSGTYRGQYSELNFDKTFSGKPLKSSFESSGVVGSAEVPDVGGVDDGRGSPNR